jgi:hypothetical protein
VKAGCAVHAVAIEERDRAVSEIGRTVDEHLGQRGSLEKAEGRRQVELDVRRRRRQSENSKVKS